MLGKNKSVTLNSHCPTCKTETKHHQILLQKKSKYGDSKEEQRDAFIDGIVSGVGGGPLLASIDLIDRHLICDVCGIRRIENEGKEFQ